MNKEKWQAWRANPPLLLIYLLFFFLSIGSIYFVLLQEQHFFFGDDLAFHLSRIEGLVQSIQQGEWFPRINYFITGGMGYATGIFYPDAFLYPAALLRLAGLSTVHSYVLFVVAMNFCTFVSAYHCFYYLKGNRWGGLLFAFFYGLSSYRMSDVVYRAAVGETLAFILIPIVFVSFYEVVIGKYQKWPFLAMSMAGLFLAHLLSTVIVGLFLIGFLLLNLKTFLKEKKRWLALSAAAGTTVLLVANWLFPMIEQLQFQRLKVQDEPVFYLQREAESLISYVQTAWQNIGFNNLGLVSFLMLLICLLLIHKQSTFARQFTLLGGLFFLLATNFFPHWLFHGTILNTIQFPWRYFVLVVFCFTWVFSDEMIALWPSRQKIVLFLVSGLALSMIGLNLHGQAQLRDFKARRRTYAQINHITSTEGSLGYGREFLPSGMESWALATGLISQPKETGNITHMARENNVFSLAFDATEPTRLIFPVIYYKGYIVEGIGDISEVHDAGMYEGTNMHGFVEVTVNGKGELRLWYQGTGLQTLSFWISVCSWFGLAGSLYWKRGQHKKTMKSEVIEID